MENVKFWITPPLKRYATIEPESIEKVEKNKEYTIQIIVSLQSNISVRDYSEDNLNKDLEREDEDLREHLNKDYDSKNYLKNFLKRRIPGLVFVTSEKSVSWFRFWKSKEHKIRTIHPKALKVLINIKEPSLEEIPEGFTLVSSDLIEEDSESENEFVNNEIIIGFKSEVNQETIRNIILGINGVFLGTDKDLNWYQVRVPILDPAELDLLIQELELFSEVKFATRHWFGEIMVKYPEDPEFNSDTWDEDNPNGKNWGQEFVKLPSAWDATIGSEDIKVGVVDSGFDLDHNDLLANIFYTGPVNFVRHHGTHVAGIIGAQAENSIGIAGTMWESALLLYSVGDPFEEARFDVPLSALALKAAAYKGARVVNFSAGIESLLPISIFIKKYNKLYADAINWLIKQNKDVLFVFAAGNKNRDAKFTSPANLSGEFNNVITVGAIQPDGNLADFSNYGELVNIVAPGGDGLPIDEGDIFSTLPNNGYGYLGGTSMAAPFVTGLAGLIWSKAEELGEELSAAEVKDLIIQGAINGGKSVSGPDNKQIPIINAYESLKLLIGLPPGPGLADTSWPMFQHDLRHTGQSEYLGPQTANLKWTFDTGSSITSSPIIGFDNTIYIGSRDGNFYAINPDGSQKWVYDTESTIYHSTPVLSQDGTIYFGSEDGYVYAINPDGTLKWRFIYASDDIFSSPAIAIGPDGTIYIGSELQNNLYALTPGGNLKWRYHANGYFNSSPSIAEDGTIYIGSGPGTNFALHAINPDGSRKWIHPVDSWIYWSSSAISATDGTIYIGSYTIPSFNPQEGRVYAINPDGSRKWTYNTGGKVDSSPAIGSDGTIYIGSDDGKIQALNSGDGSLKWEYTATGPVIGSSAIDEQGNLYVGSYDGKVYCFGQ